MRVCRGASKRPTLRMCLRLEPNERPDVDELIDIVEDVLRELPEDGSDD